MNLIGKIISLLILGILFFFVLLAVLNVTEAKEVIASLFLVLIGVIAKSVMDK